MARQVFVPVTDEMLYEHPEFITSPLQPYRTGMSCFHWSAEIEHADKSTRVVQMSDFTRHSAQLFQSGINPWARPKISVA